MQICRVDSAKLFSPLFSMKCVVCVSVSSRMIYASLQGAIIVRSEKKRDLRNNDLETARPALSQF